MVLSPAVLMVVGLELIHFPDECSVVLHTSLPLLMFIVVLGNGGVAGFSSTKTAVVRPDLGQLSHSVNVNLSLITFSKMHMGRRLRVVVGFIAHDRVLHQAVRFQILHHARIR